MASHKTLILSLTNLLLEENEESKKEFTAHCLCTKGALDSSFYRKQIEESQQEAIECLSYMEAAIETKEGSPEMKLILNSQAKITCDKSKRSGRFISTKGLLSQARVDKDNLCLDWSDLLDALVVICMNDSLTTDDAIVAAETLSFITSKMNPSFLLYDSALTSLSKFMSKENNKCTEFNIKVLVSQSKEQTNSTSTANK